MVVAILPLRWQHRPVHLWVRTCFESAASHSTQAMSSRIAWMKEKQLNPLRHAALDIYIASNVSILSDLCHTK